MVDSSAKTSLDSYIVSNRYRVKYKHSVLTTNLQKYLTFLCMSASVQRNFAISACCSLLVYAFPEVALLHYSFGQTVKGDGKVSDVDFNVITTQKQNTRQRQEKKNQYDTSLSICCT